MYVRRIKDDAQLEDIYIYTCLLYTSVAFSSDGLVNSLVLNSGYSVLYAAQQFKDEGASSESYGKMDTDEMLRIVKALSLIHI